jgi:hypothetical protein
MEEACHYLCTKPDTLFFITEILGWEAASQKALSESMQT